MTPTPPYLDPRNKLRSGKGQTSTPTDKHSAKNSDDNAIQQILNTNNILLVQNKEILKKINEVENSIQFLSNKYDELKLMYEKMTDENSSLKKINTHMTNKLDELKNDNNNMHSTINDIKQDSLKTNIVIFGVPPLNDNNSLQHTFDQILNKLDISKEEMQVDDIYQKKTNTEQSPIFVKFRMLQDKINFKQAAKTTIQLNKRHLYTNDIGFKNNNKITFVDQLTDVNQKLLREAKTLRAHGYQYIWTSTGKIFAKRDDTTNPTIIKTLHSIESLKTQNTTI